jgi:hypothetical protein
VSCVFFAVLFAGLVAANPAAIRADLDRANQKIAALNLDPEGVRMAQQMISGTFGLVLFAVMYVLMTLVFLMIFGGVAGALAAGKVRNKGP